MSEIRILVVKDEDIAALDIQSSLRRLSYAVPAIARSGEEAVQKAEEMQPDLVLIDIELKGEMDGVEAAEEIRTRFDIPVVYLAACADDKMLQRAKFAGPFGYILTPFEEKELHSTVEMALYRHQMERRLRESERKYRDLVERAKDGIVIIQDGRLKYVNPRVAELSGYTVEELLDSPLTKYIHPDELPEVVDRYKRRMAGEDVTPIYETILKRKDGSDVYVELNAGLITYRGEPANLVLARDITERKRLERETEKRRLYLEGVLNATPDAVVTLDIEHNIVEWNPGAEKLFGYSREEVVGQELDHLVAGRDASMFEQAIGFTQQVLAGDPVPPTGTVRYRKNGTPVDVILAVAPITVDDELVGIVATYTDITERKRMEETLRESEEKYRTILENIEDGYYEVDIAGNLTFFNDALRRILGYTNDELMGMNNREYMDEETAKAVYQTFNAVYRTGTPARAFDWEIIRKDGTRRIVEASISLISDPAGEPNGFRGILRDVTDRKRAEKALKRRAAQLATLNRIGRQVTSILDRQELLQQAVNAVQEDLGYLQAAVLLVDEAANELYVVAATDNFWESIPDDYRQPVGKGAIGMAVETGETVLVTGAESDRRLYRERKWLSPSSLSAPIEIGGHVVGILEVEDDMPDAFDRNDVLVINTLADQIATAIENARLYEAEHKRSKQLTAVSKVAESIASILNLDELLQQTVELVTRTFGYYHTGILLLDTAAKELVFKASAGGYAGETPVGFRQKVKEGMIGWAAHLGETLLANDVSQEPRYIPAFLTETKAELDVPLQYRGRVIGVLDLQSKTLNAFDQHDVTAMETLADHIATAIENARLYEEARQRALEQKTLRETALAMTTTLERDEVIERILAQLQEVVPYDTASVQLLREDRMEIVGERGFPNPPEIVGLSFPVKGDNPNREVVRTRAPFIVDDVSVVYEDFRCEPHDSAAIRSWLGVPMLMGEQMLGMIALDKREPGFYTQNHARLAEAFAAQAAAAVENARLFEERHQRVAELEALRGISLQMTASLDLSAVLDSVVASALSLVEANDCHIYLYDEEDGSLTFGTALWKDGKREAAVETPRQEGITATVAREGQPVVINAAPRHPLYASPEAQAWGIQAIAGFPLKRAGRVLGVFTITFLEAHTFTNEELRVLSLLADQAAIAVENVRLFETEQRQRELAERLQETALLVNSSLALQEVLEMILDQLARVIPYDSGTIQLVEPNATRVLATRNLPPAELNRRYPFDQFAYNRKVVEEGKPIVIDDMREDSRGWVSIEGLEHVRANIGVPLQVRGQVIGLMTVDSCQPGAYAEDDAHLAQAFAQQAAVAIENARLFQAEQEQRELAEGLAEAAAAVSSTLDLDEVLDLILERVERVVGGDAFNVMLVENGSARVARRRGYECLETDRQIATGSVTIEEYPGLARMAETGKPIAIPNTSIAPNWIQEEIQEQWQSYVGAPIQVGDMTVGFLSVNGLRPGQFGPDDARRLKAFADHTATAVENARLYQQLRDHAETLEEQVAQRTAQLRTQYAQLEAILHSTADGIVVADVDGELILTNPVAKTWLTKSLSPEDAAQLRTAVQDLVGRAEKRPAKVLELTGLDLELRAAPIAEPEMEHAIAVVAIHDVSHLKALDRMKTRFITSVSHELRTPIATIKLFAQLMQQRPERWQEYLEPLAQEAEHQARLVEDILEISRVDAGRVEVKPEPTALNDLTELTVYNHEQWAQERGLTLEYCPTEPGPTVLADPHRMTQVLNNLMSNAILYTPEGGKVTISTDTAEMEGRTWATAAVSDTGMGIPKDELPHIFDRFLRGEKPRLMQISGTGLGLTIAKEIIELHGGRVTVESKIGKGSTFTVWLPLAD